jgi:pimeloyl-ACP methyl ester carboxylesterase
VSDLASVRAPIHLVYGTLDPLLHPAGLRIVESLRGVTAHKVQGVDHAIRPRMARVVATAIG